LFGFCFDFYVIFFAASAGFFAADWRYASTKSVNIAEVADGAASSSADALRGPRILLGNRYF
jgi:hypothetical protein